MSTKSFILFLYCTFCTLMASAQASGGQIRRQQPRSSVHTQKPSKPKTTSENTQKSSKPKITATTSSIIEPISMSSLATYNVVVTNLSVLGNAQALCRKLRIEGWGAQIYSSSSNMYYYVLIVSSSNEQEAIEHRNRLRQTYPNAWILKIENGREIRIE